MSSKEVVIGYLKQFMMERGIPESTAKIPEQDAWVFSFGSIRIQVSVKPFSQAGKQNEGISVGGLIMNIPADPEKKLKLYEKLLFYNNQMVQIAFAINSKGFVILTASREVENLQFEEFVNMVENVARVGDSLDEELKALAQ